MKKQIIVSAGDAITAKLVEEAGFDGIWVSGFEASARLGLADNGSITMFEMLNIAKPIVDSVSIPVWVDVDTGYGNFLRTVREFEKIGVHGISVEDNLSQYKQNSLWGEKIPLMSMEDFGKKLNKVAWDDRKIKIIARTEALIRGYGKEDAWSRMAYYRQCGADILLPHIRKYEDILVPNVGIPYAIVPTKFPNVTNKELFDKGYDLVIWANQTERVKIKAIRDALKDLKHKDCALGIENDLSATLDDLKGLTPDE